MWSKAKLPTDIAFWINQRRKKDTPLRSVPSQTPGSGAKHGWYGKWRRRRRASWQLSQTQTFPVNIGDYVSYETVEVILWAVYQVWIFWTPSSCVLCKVIQDILSYLVHLHAVSFCRDVGPGCRGISRRGSYVLMIGNDISRVIEMLPRRPPAGATSAGGESRRQTPDCVMGLWMVAPAQIHSMSAVSSQHSWQMNGIDWMYIILAISDSNVEKIENISTL